MLKYREDLEKVVTKEEIEKRNEIVDKTNERGWFFKKKRNFYCLLKERPESVIHVEGLLQKLRDGDWCLLLTDMVITFR